MALLARKCRAHATKTTDHQRTGLSRDLDVVVRDVELLCAGWQRDVELVMAPWMTPGSVIERLHLFAAAYPWADRLDAGGGLVEEGEDIEVLELPFTEALAQVRAGRIDDAKTVLLLRWAALWGPFAR